MGCLVGRACQDCTYSLRTTGKKIGKVIDKIDNGLGILNKGLDNGQKTIGKAEKFVDKVNSFINISNGAVILGMGLTLGCGLWAMGIYCNPTCNNLNAEFVRLGAITLSVIGVGIVIFSGIKQEYKS